MTSESTEQHGRAETVGVMLQAARQQRGLTVKQIADAQHLRPAVITAIEEGRYVTIGSELFLKGYIRSYAAQVGLDGDAIIRSLEAELAPLRKEREEKQESGPLVEIERRKRKKRRIARTILGITVLILLLALLFQLFLAENDDQESAPPESDPAEQQTPAMNTGSATPESESASLNDTPIVAVSEQAEQDPQEAEPAEPASAPAEPDELQSEPVTEPPVEPVVEPERPAAAAPVVSTPGNASLRASFSGDCWIQITDGEGQRLASSLKQAGDTLDVSGTPPLKIVVGAMSGLSSLTFQGEAVDLSTFRVTNNRAEFSLDI